MAGTVCNVLGLVVVQLGEVCSHVSVANQGWDIVNTNLSD